MLGSKAHWRFAVCVVSVPVIVLAGGCSSSKPSSSPSGQAPASQQATPGGAGADQMSRPNAPSPGKVTSGILAFVSNGNKQIYSFIDPNSGQYSEAVTFTIPSAAAAQARPVPRVAASPDLTKFAVTSMVNGQSMAGWIDPSGQFTAVTTSTTPGAFGGNPPSYSAIGFDGAGNYYYKKNSQGAMYTEVYKVPAGSTSNAQQVTLTPPSAADHGVAVNSDGSLLFGCETSGYSWLNANTVVMAVAPGTQIAKVPLAGRFPGGCPNLPGASGVPLLPASNTATVHDPVANSDGTKVAFFYDDPDRVKHNFPTLYIVGTDGNSQPTMVNLSESDAKKLAFATFLRWT
jgi:hypothetical protein